MDIEKIRPLTRKKPQMIPKPASEQSGIVSVDTTWGKIQPMKIADNVRVVDELEVYEFQEKKLQLIDARTSDFYDVSTIQGAKNIPHNKIKDRMDELDKNRPAILFCNGPQCPQSPTAIRNLLEAGYPPFSARLQGSNICG
jgi:rhodanese-related sulfurtransferase